MTGLADGCGGGNWRLWWLIRVLLLEAVIVEASLCFVACLYIVYAAESPEHRTWVDTRLLNTQLVAQKKFTSRS